jgi:diaminohydroxyphosphoribosylaminopyrimidine deaminase/5-amino-6-(5-phosphoribosylamino)uracil reductase
VARALVDDCDRANRPFLTWAETGRPAVTLKAGITLDGKIATVAGNSQWITGEAARTDVMYQRNWHDAILVGIGTVLADDPRLTARYIPDGRDPTRIVVDTRLRTPATARLLPKNFNKRSPSPRTIIACGPDAPASREKALVERGAEVWRLRARRGRVDLERLATRLGDEGITSVLVEGGGEIHAAFLDRRLFDTVILYIAPVVVGGPAPSWVGGKGVRWLESAYKLDIEEAIGCGADLRITCRRRPDEPRTYEPPDD